MSLYVNALIGRIAATLPDGAAGADARTALNAVGARLAEIDRLPDLYPSASQVWAEMKALPEAAHGSPDILARRIDRVMLAADQDAVDAAYYALDRLDRNDITDLGREPAALVQRHWRTESLRAAAIYLDALRAGTYLETPVLPGFAHRDLDHKRFRFVMLTRGGVAERFEGTLLEIGIALSHLFPRREVTS